VRRILWEEFIDRNLMSALCTKNYGLPISLASYLEALPHTSGLLRISKESRSLLPLLNCIPPHHWERQDIFKSDVLRETSVALSGLDDIHLRCLRKLPASVLCKLHYRDRLRDVLDLLLGIQLQERIPVSVLRRVVKHSWKPFAFPDVCGTMPELQRIYRLYIRHCLNLWKQQGREELRRYLKNGELSQIMDWFLAIGKDRGQPDKNVTWDSLVRVSRAWHAQFEEPRIRNAENARTKPVSWGSLVGKTEIAGVRIRPLTSKAALKAEGRKMHHCVASYASRCARLSFRIFSLTEESGIRSTLCICPGRSGRWRVYEHSGFKNSRVSLRAAKAANTVCRLYGEAQKAILVK
jgi:hypothetical protein